MNREQAKSIARWLVATFGGLIVGIGTSRGYSSDTILAVLNSETFLGLLGVLISLGWSILSKTPLGLILAAANVGAVKEISVADSSLAVQAATRTDRAKIVAL